MPWRSDVTGAILAGGGSSRMGSDKALLPFLGKTVIRHIADEMKNVFAEVIIISDRGNAYNFLGLPVFRDTWKNCGPLGGIHSALTNAATETVFVTPCDMPFIDGNLIGQLLALHEEADIVVVSDGRIIHPLFGLFNRVCLPAISECLGGGRCSVKALLDLVRWKAIRVEGNLLFNLNTGEDYRTLIRAHIGHDHELANGTAEGCCDVPDYLIGRNG